MRYFSKRTRLRETAGFTLIELMIAMVIGLAVTYSLYQSYIFLSDVNRKQGGKVDAVQNARNAMDILTRDIRMIGSGTPDSVAAKITAADNKSITYLANFWNISTELSSRAASGAGTLTVDSTAGFITAQNIYICNDSSASAVILLDAAPADATTITLPANLTANYANGCPVNVVDTVLYEYEGSPNEIKRTLTPINALNSGNKETLADNIDYVQLNYYDSAGTEIGTVGTALTAAEILTIRKIKVLIVGVSPNEDGPVVTTTYGDGSYKTDGNSRIYLESEIKLRNIS